VLKSSHYTPDEGGAALAIPHQFYTYDSLNRLTSVAEYFISDYQPLTQTSLQSYTYDRWGNRTINAGQTWGTGINSKQFTVDPAGTNRLTVPSGQSGVMSYDNAGNLTTDTYSSAGTRIYDAENRMTTAADYTGQMSRYTYNADGQRTRRQVAGSQEEWQIYGFDGELVAEYRASTPASSPEKEYGYRNGQLLVTATGRFNVALAANGAVATASSAHTCCGFSTVGAINGNNRGPWANGEGWNDATENVVPDWIQVDFAGSKTIDEINVFSLHDNYTQENTPTETQTFSLYGLLAFNVQYWNGSSWVTLPGGSVTGNNKVWRKFTFSPVTTNKIRVFINTAPDAWSRVVEIQAFGTSAGGDKIQWLVPDHLGTPRIVLDQTGSLAGVRRHDYLPFGEELFAGSGGRTGPMGYAVEGIRQQFTQKERDVETGLDYFGARYYASPQGPFTSPDDFLNDTAPVDPASWNLYAYVRNNPLRHIDPNGEKIYAGDVRGADRDELLKRANFTYGCETCVSVDSDGFLAVDTSGLSQDVLKATAFLTDAITSNDAKKLFSVEVANNNSEVAFGDSQAGMAGVQLPGNNFKTSAIRIRLDFGDDKRVTGDKDAKDAFLNLVFSHEVKHFYPNYIQDPSDGRQTGPVVDAINEIQQARGLLLRAEYGATKRTSGGEFVSLNFGTARMDRRGNIVRNKAGGIEVNTTNKVITWIKRSVGGKGIN
jgi:RHS repeat-associated protein